MNAVAGILILLYSQFGSCCIETYGMNSLCCQDMDDYDNEFDADVIFEINPPQESDWLESELYEFEWSDIVMEEEPFEKFPF